jgi:hypothetical protein
LQPGIDVGPLLGAEAAAHVLLDVGRTQVAFCLIIGERYSFYPSKRQHCIFMFFQTPQHISPRSTFGLALARFGFRRWLFRFRFGTDVAIFLSLLFGRLLLQGGACEAYAYRSSNNGCISLAHADPVSINPCNARTR